MKSEIKLLYIDLFCGAGGTTTGVEMARNHGSKCAQVIACVNHDPIAIASHAANHPDVVHYTEDIRTLDLSGLMEHTARKRSEYPNAKVVLWASLECTNFSKAKGGQPRDADSRTLAEHLFRYIDTLQPDYIQIENVEEFMSWGDLDSKGHPVSKDKGRKYVRWTKDIIKRGYNFDHHILNSADFGAYTSRKRYFGQFAKKGLRIAFPIPTYSKEADNGGLFHTYKKWKPVREVLDLDDEGTSIFVREKPLCEKTLERIYAGLVKFVAGGKKKHEAWILKYNSMNQEGHHNAPSIDEPCPTVAVQNRLGLVKVQYLSKQFSGNPTGKNISIDKPCGTITCIDHHALTTAQFITEYYGGADHNHSLDVPASVVTTRGRHALVGAHFLDAYYGNGHQHSISLPAPTITTKDRLSIINCSFIDNQYGNGTPTSIDTSAPTIVNNPKQQLVTCKKWIMNTNFNNVGSSLDCPSPVITANHKQHYLMNPQFQSAGGSIDKPCFTLIARMDKMPPYLISTEQGVGIEIYETDSPMTRTIKEFMAAYGIVDIKMRMLNIHELKRIMGFPDDYVLKGSQAEQKKFIGNAVEVNMSRALCEALCDEIKN